jgi:beta-galactosidase/beta-glucuronidase
VLLEDLKFYINNTLNFSVLLLGWIRERDPSRLVHYEGGGSRTTSTDIICPMYMRVWDIVKIAKDPTEPRPLILCEYVTSVLLYELH